MNSLVHKRAIGMFLVMCFLVGTAALSVGASPAAPTLQAPQSAPGGQPVVLVYDPTPSVRDVPSPWKASLSRTQSAIISINYLSGGSLGGRPCSTWPVAAQTAFDYAAGIWESLINSSVPIEINACWTSFTYTTTLGASGAVSYIRDFTGAPASSTWYQVALANARNGADLNDSDGFDHDGDGLDADADMNIWYNQDRPDWYFGIDGNPGESELDFASVVLHEICHGLGFAGSMDWDDGIGTLECSGTYGEGCWGQGTGYPFAYDRFTEDGGGENLIASFGNPSAELGTQLTSDDLYFDGPHANAANGGNPPKLYAPNAWDPGSSYSHLDYDTYNDTENELMVWAISHEEAIHHPGTVTLGMLEDFGWTIGQPVPDVGIVKQVAGGTGLQPGDPITFTLSIENSGTLTATNVVVTDTMPAEVLTPTFASTLAITPTGVFSYVWDVEPLAAGQSGVITIGGWIDSSLASDFSFTNVATISDPGDGTPGNNTSSVTVGERKVYLPLVLRGYPPPAWVTIVSEDFEGSFPGSTWSVGGSDSGSGRYYWGKRDCRNNGGAYSGWSVGAGDTILSCGSNYPNNVQSWMIYGPFSLADASAAELSFDWWSDTQLDHDDFFWGASSDGSYFYGTNVSGDWSSWTTGQVLDLSAVPGLGDLTGDGSVWIVFLFISDSSGTDRGTFVDNILLRKYVGGAGASANVELIAPLPTPASGQTIEFTTIWLNR